jgi:hypothetical protein
MPPAVMSLLYHCFRGPNLYARLNPKQEYEPNLLEKTGGGMLYVSRLIRSLLWPTSPFWILYCSTRMSLSLDGVIYYAWWIFVYHAFAFSLRTTGRLFSETYRTFIRQYADFVESTSKTSMLRDYDFQASCFRN